jgi:hypothetical protein
VTLEVDPTSDPIQGIARDERGAERTFSGWVGLAAALEHALELDAPPASWVGTKARPE